MLSISSKMSTIRLERRLLSFTFLMCKWKNVSSDVTLETCEHAKNVLTCMHTHTRTHTSRQDVKTQQVFL